MSGSIFLQIFLIINIFFIGMLTAIGLRHAIAHFRPEKHDAERIQHKPATRLPIATKERLLHVAETQFQTIIDNSAKELERDLLNINQKINKKVEVESDALANVEFKRYKQDIDKLCAQVEQKLETAQEEIIKYQQSLQDKLDKQQAELENQLQIKLKTKEQQLLTAFDTKMNDAIISFLTETMGHNVDIGAQSDYLIAMLNENKQELVKGVANEV